MSAPGIQPLIRNIASIRLLIVAVFWVLVLAGTLYAKTFDDEEIKALGAAILFGPPAQMAQAAELLTQRGNPDALATLILASRYRGAAPQIMEAINTLAKQPKDSPIRGWHDAMLWQEEHGEIKPHSSFVILKTTMFNNIDPNFDRFLGGERAKPGNMKIRLEEIVWGGVIVDGIPSLDNPKLINVTEATYLVDSDLVFGVEINGDIRAYPLRIMGWHEMFNETIGGVPVALAYCTLCGAGILFETAIEGRDKPLVFGSSGFLYRSNKLMFDRQTNSLWNQFTGEPVSGPLVNAGIKLKIRPVTITSWGHWKSSHPETKVLSLDTGHRRNYGSGVVYNDYFSSPNLMFPANSREGSPLQPKDYVFGIRDVGAAKAWPVKAFENIKVINDSVGGLNVVLIGDAASRTVRAYQRQDQHFSSADKPDALLADGESWTITEDALVGAGGTKLPRVPGHISYWFAWDGYLGVESALYSAAK